MKESLTMRRIGLVLVHNFHVSNTFILLWFIQSGFFFWFAEYSVFCYESIFNGNYHYPILFVPFLFGIFFPILKWLEHTETGARQKRTLCFCFCSIYAIHSHTYTQLSRFELYAKCECRKHLKVLLVPLKIKGKKNSETTTDSIDEILI